jgi:hypothetical protein
MKPRRLILMGEGQGDAAALPALVRRLLRDSGAAGELIFEDRQCMRIGGIGKLLKDNGREWLRFLAIAQRQGAEGVLLVVDADVLPPRFGSCVAEVARHLAALARDQAGQVLSVVVVLARKEFESWLIAGLEPLAGRTLTPPPGRPGGSGGSLVIPADLKVPAEEPETHGKAWLQRHLRYKETAHQALLARHVDLVAIRRCNLRSFQRLESALQELRRATGHTCSPLPTPAPGTP